MIIDRTIATCHVERRFQMTPELVLRALEGRLGKANGITAHDLVRNITGHESEAEERRLRLMIEHLRRQGHAICAHPSIGYYLAANDGDLNSTCEYLTSRAMTSLTQVAAMRRVAMPDLRGQLGLPSINSQEDDDAGSDA